MTYSADDILLEREQRVELIHQLLDKYDRPVVFIRVNYPGLNKINPVTEGIINNIQIVVSSKLKDKIQLRVYKAAAEGPTIAMVLDEEAMDVKKITIEIEDECMLGRYVDIDVYDPVSLQGISRSSFGIPARKCYLCEDIAHNCVRSRKHTESEVIEFIHNAYEDFMKNNEKS